MAILNEITVGDIKYQLVDSIPVSTEPRGTVAILKQPTLDSAISYVNIDGGTKWVQLMTPAFGKSFFTGNTTAVNPTQNTWVNLNASSWSAGDLKNFTVAGTNNERLTYNSGQPAALFAIFSDTTINGVSQREYRVENAPVINNTSPVANTQAGSTTESGVLAHISTIRMETLVGGDYINFAHKWTANSGGGPQNGYILSNVAYNVIKIRELFQTILFSDDFESGNFTAGGWTVVNGAETNKWTVGTATASTGSNSAYISNNNGTSNSYTNTADSQSHIYVDVAIPANALSTTIQFDWKCQGENAAGDDQYDFGRVYVAPTTITPTAGVLPNVVYQVGLIKYNLQSTFTSTSIVLNSTYSGSTRRFIFTWNNDATVGTNPPFAIDNVRISSIQ